MPKVARPVRHEGGLIHQLAVIIGVSVLSGVLIAGLALPWIGLLGKGAQTSADAVKNFPLPLKFSALSERTTVLAADGTRLATFYDENRKYVALNQISYTMRQAIIAIEDSRFYEHGAIDVEGTGRAFVVNLFNGGVVQGGSTITQQLVKLTRVENATTAKQRTAATEDTQARKVEELRYALWVEDHLTKNEILEHYLNTAYYGDGAYGIEAAAHHYFSTTAAKLDLTQSALLAGLVKNPTGYDPTNSKSTARNRRNTVLDRMLDLHVITTKEAKRAKRSPLGLKLSYIPNGCISTDAPWFCDYLLNYMLQDRELGKTVEERKHLIYGGGLTIKTTISLRDQRAADTSVARHVFPGDKAVGALALVEPGTGYVRALAQSRPMGTKKRNGDSFLNYTVPKQYGDANGFQAGSNFKPFVLTAAIKQRIPLNTQINSPSPLNISQARFSNCPGAPRYPDVNWAVHNSTGTGSFNLITGTQQSVNSFYAQLEQMTGVCQPWNLAKQMGVHLTDPARNRFPSFTLGTVDVSPLEMAEAYATFAARGLHCDATPILEIRDRAGTVIPTSGPQCNRVMQPAQADAVNSILRGVQELPNGFGNIYGDDINQPSAAKTGTTSDTKAVWFTGYTPNLATASVIAGIKSNGDPQDLRGLSVHGSILTNESAAGSALAGPMWQDAMEIIAQWLPNKNFVSPDPTVIVGQTITIPSYFGYSPQVAAAQLTSLGFRPQIAGGVYSDAPYGTVAYTSPSGEAASGQTVVIYTSIGPAPVVQPPPSAEPPPPSGTGGGGTDGGGTGGGTAGGGTGGGTAGGGT
ncbi:MAG: transglycosylase domain-containing protein, partial [Propionibacteriales bacterium]|nr:transglycosylase domain-containing protein [Propionibacteriales bacterium]